MKMEDNEGYQIARQSKRIDELEKFAADILHTLGDPGQWDGVQWANIRAMIVEGRDLLQTNKEKE